MAGDVVYLASAEFDKAIGCVARAHEQLAKAQENLGGALPEASGLGDPSVMSVFHELHQHWVGDLEQSVHACGQVAILLPASVKTFTHVSETAAAEIGRDTSTSPWSNRAHG